MNRQSFLSTLPFLYEVPSNEWPPTISEDTTSGKTRRQFLFRDHCLSLEPFSPDSGETLGPAFFVPSTDREKHEPFDAAMCRVEMVLFTTSKKTRPSYKLSRTPNKSPAAKALVEMEFKEYVAFMLIDGRVYQVDLEKIHGAEVKGSQAAGESTTRQPPPCLLIQFPNCFFRIFSLVHHATDLYSILNTCKGEIINVITNNGDNYCCPFPTKEFLDLTSPMGSSTAPSSEPGQQETSRPSSEDTSSRRSSSVTTSNNNKPDTNMEKRCQDKTQQSLKALHAAQEDLESLRQLLTPKSAHQQQHQQQQLQTQPSSTSTEELRTTASNLLTSVADNVGASFCTHEEVIAAANGFDKEIDGYRSQVDKLLKAVWPSTNKKRPKKRQRQSKLTRSDPPLRQDVKDDCIEHVEMLLAKHKKALESKYALANLPTRG